MPRLDVLNTGRRQPLMPYYPKPWEGWGPEDMNERSFKQGVCPVAPGFFAAVPRNHGPAQNILYCTVILPNLSCTVLNMYNFYWKNFQFYF